MPRIGLGLGLGLGGPRVWTPARLPAGRVLRWSSARTLTQFAAGTTDGSGAVSSGGTAGRWTDLSTTADAFVQASAGLRPVVQAHAKGKGAIVNGSGELGAGGKFMATGASVSGIKYIYAVATIVGPDSNRTASADPPQLWADGYHGLTGTAPVATGAVLLTGFAGQQRWTEGSLTEYARDGTVLAADATAMAAGAALAGYGRRRTIHRVKHGTTADAGALNLLRHVGYDGFYWRGGVHEIIALSASTTAAELLKIEAYLQSFWLAGALVVVTGDSLMAGYNLTETQGPAGLLHEAYNRCVSVPAIAVPGQGIGSSISPLTDTLLTTDAAKLAALKARHSPAVVVALCGTNDLANSRTAAQLRADLIAYCAAVQALGWKVIVGTIASRTKDTDGVTNWPAGKETERTTFNTALRADHAFADGFVDVDTIAPTLAGDGIHWTSGGTASVTTGTGGIKDAVDALLP